MYCDLLTIGTWGHPSSLRHADILSEPVVKVLLIYISSTSHCVDMYINRPGDPDELQGTRAMIGDLVSKWIMEANA